MKNILLLVMDCARTEKTLAPLPGGSRGTGRSARLPFLDHLRSRGTTWTHLTSVSSTTTPNFASIFTGLLPARHGIIEHSRHRLAEGVATLAEILSARGYHTAAEVTGPLIPEAGLNRGFARYRCRERTEYLHRGFARYLRDLVPRLPEPWFLCLHCWEAHEPYQSVAPFDRERYGLTPYDRALSLADHYLMELFKDLDFSRTSLVYTGDHGERLIEDYALNRSLGGREWEILKLYGEHLRRHPGPLDPEAWRRTLEQAFGENEARIYAHTVLGHGFHLTEELVRVPLVIVDPDRCRAGKTIGELRSQVDLFPTLLDLAGEEEAGGQGEGVEREPEEPASLLRRAQREAVYLEANGSGGRAYKSRCTLRGARTERWKYWRLEGEGPDHAVLWDLKKDPRETLSCIERHPEIASELDAFIERSLAGAPAAPRTVPFDEEAAKIEAKMRELGYL